MRLKVINGPGRCNLANIVHHIHIVIIKIVIIRKAVRHKSIIIILIIAK